MTFKPMPLMSILMIPAIAVLVYLGSWQWNRYNEKLAASEGVGLTETFALDVTPASEDLQFVYSTFDGDPVWRVFQPVTGCMTGEDGNETCSEAPLFVNLGLIQGFDPEAALADRVRSETITGRYRVVPDGHHTVLTPDDRPDEDIWYTATANVLAEHLSLAPADEAKLFEPETIRQFALVNGEILSRQIANPYVNIANLDDLPPARHLGYSITWFGLLLGMIGVYIALHIARGRLRFS